MKNKKYGSEFVRDFICQENVYFFWFLMWMAKCLEKSVLYHHQIIIFIPFSSYLFVSNNTHKNIEFWSMPQYTEITCAMDVQKRIFGFILIRFCFVFFFYIFEQIKKIITFLIDFSHKWLKGFGFLIFKSLTFVLQQ